MAHKDSTGLAWSGRPAPRSSGGFVDAVGLNERPAPLAVDPNGVVGPMGRARGACAAGPQLTVTRMDASADGPVQPSGRVRLTPT